MPSYIFMDESGDLGLDFRKPKTSKYFVISFLFVTDKKPVEKIVKKIFKDFSKTEINCHSDTLHSFKEKPKTRKKLLQLLNELDVSVMSIYLNKRKVYTKLNDAKHALYNYVTNILLDRVATKKLLPKKSEIILIASRRETNKFLNQNFTKYIEKQLEVKHGFKIKVAIEAPSREKCLQVVDFVSWAIFRKYEHGDESYTNIIKNKVFEESPLFP